MGAREREREATKSEVEGAPRAFGVSNSMNRSLGINGDERHEENERREENASNYEKNERGEETEPNCEKNEPGQENEPNSETNERRKEESERPSVRQTLKWIRASKQISGHPPKERMTMNRSLENGDERHEENEPIEMHERSFEEIKMTERREENVPIQEMNERREENEPMEMNERCEENQLKLQRIRAPKRIPRHPPKKKKMLKEDWRLKAEELEGKCSGLTKQLEECRGRSLQNEILEAQCSGLTKQLEECRGAFTLNKLPLLAPCKCHFFSTANQTTTYDDYVAQSSVQIFLRNVRYLRRLNHQTTVSNIDQEPLTMVIDFVIELSCQTKPIHLKGRYAEVYVHHAVNLIKDTIPLLHEENENKRGTVDNLVAKLLLNLVEKLLNFSSDLNSTPGEDSAVSDLDDREKILAIMLSLAECGYIGHRMLLTTSHEIAMVLERFQCMDPFDEGFSQTFENLYFTFDLVEKLVAAHMTSWKEENKFSQDILEEWVTCHFHCKTTIERQPTAWTTQLMIVLDNITAKLLEQLHRSAESDRQDTWQKALVHLLASATSAITQIHTTSRLQFPISRNMS